VSMARNKYRLAAVLMAIALPASIAHAQTADSPPPRPAALMPLYVTFAGLQALDFDSTLRAVKSVSGREVNPAVKILAGSPAALLAVKVGTTASIFWASERLRKRRHPAAAVVLMILLDSAYAGVAAHNYAILRQRH
jgi:hypothetical protein